MARARLAAEQAQFYTTQTGRIGEGGQIDAVQLGIDLTNPDKNQVKSQIKQALQAANLDASPSNVFIIQNGYKLPTGGQVTLATVDQATQAAMQGRSLDIDQARIGIQQQAQNTADLIAVAEQTGKIKIGGVAVETLQAKQFILNRQLETADRTGQMMAQVTALDFGIDSSQYLSDIGNITNYSQYALAVTGVREAFTVAFGRAPLPTEVDAIARGQTITTSVLTLAGRQLQSEADWKEYQQTLEAANLTGSIKDPLTGGIIPTLSKQAQTDLQTFQSTQLTNQAKQITNAHTEFTSELGQRMQEFATTAAQEWAQLTGQTAFTTSIEASDLGISLSDPTQTAADRDAALKQAFKARFGKEATPGELQMLAVGYSVSVQGIRTLTAQELDASVANIYTQIDLNKKQFQQEATQYLAENARAWAQINGMGYGNSQLKASDLGVDMADTSMTAEEKKTALKDSFKALTGKDLSPTQLINLANSYSITVEGSPTLAARQLAAEVSAQNLGRMADMSKFSTANSLEVKQFNQAVAESDRLYGLQAQEMAQKYQMDAQRFALAKIELDGKMTGKLNISGTLSARDMGIDLAQLPTQLSGTMLGVDILALYQDRNSQNPYAVTNEEYTAAVVKILDALTARGIDPWASEPGQYNIINQLMLTGEIKSDQVARGMLTSVYQALQGKGLSSGDLTTLMTGGKINVDTLDTLEAKQWATEATNIANVYQLDVERFSEAAKEFDLSYKLNDRNMWAEITGQAIGIEEGVAAGKIEETVSYKKYEAAKVAFDESETKRDLVWDMMLRTEATKRVVEWAGLKPEGGNWSLNDIKSLGILPGSFSAADLGVDVSGVFDRFGNLLPAAKPGQPPQGWDKFFIVADQLSVALKEQGLQPDRFMQEQLIRGLPMSGMITRDQLKEALVRELAWSPDNATLTGLLANPKDNRVPLYKGKWGSPEDIAQFANFVNSMSIAVAPEGNNDGWLGIGQIIGTVVAAAVGK